MSIHATFVEKEQGYEIRTYTNITWISVDVDADDINDAVEAAFPFLFAYIRRHRFPMTTPVTAEPNDTGYTVSFFVRDSQSSSAHDEGSVRVRHQDEICRCGGFVSRMGHSRDYTYADDSPQESS